MDTPEGDADLPRGVRARVAHALRSHPAQSVFLVALVVRTILAVGVAVAFDGQVFEDDGTYVGLADAVATGRWAALDAYSQGLYVRTGTFILPLTAAFWALGTSTIVGQLYVGLWGAAAAAGTTALAVRLLPVGWALGAGLVVALYPSQVLWSALVLKDPAVWTVAVSLGLAVAVANRSVGTRLLAAGAAVAVLLVAMGFLRDHTLVVAAWSVATAAWFGRPEARQVRGLGAIVLAVVVPLVVGIGPGGVEVLARSGNLAEVRQLNAQGAATAFVPTPKTETSDESTAETGTTAAPTIENSDPSPVESPTSGADREPDGTGGTVSVEDNTTALARGLSVMLLEPYPWQPSDNRRVEVARYESFLWYPLLGLAMVGVVTALRHRPDLVAYPLLYAGGMTLAYALAEGNFGTAYRHRGELVWPVALFAAVGACWLWRRWVARPNRRESAA